MNEDSRSLQILDFKYDESRISIWKMMKRKHGKNFPECVSNFYSSFFFINNKQIHSSKYLLQYFILSDEICNYLFRFFFEKEKFARKINV